MAMMYRFYSFKIKDSIVFGITIPNSTIFYLIPVSDINLSP